MMWNTSRKRKLVLRILLNGKDINTYFLDVIKESSIKEGTITDYYS